MDHKARDNCRDPGQNINQQRPNKNSTGTRVTQANYNQDLRVYYANIDNSIMSKYGALVALLEQEPYDVITLTEIMPR